MSAFELLTGDALELLRQADPKNVPLAEARIFRELTTERKIA